MWAFAAVLVLAVGTIAGIILPSVLRDRRRRLLRTPDNDLLRARLARTRAWKRLPAPLRPRLEEQVRVFLGEREFIGCGGFKITEPVRVTIAAEACLLLLGHDRHVYDDLRAILVYPDEFVVPELWEEHGIVTEESRRLSGQSWDTSQVILSWKDVTEAGPGYNVVIHEFAHYHDHAAGFTSGAGGDRWQIVVEAAFATLEEAEAEERPCVLDPYSLESDAEFFAVATEAFIEQPEALVEDFPDVYTQLSTLYGLDPVRWGGY
jgi:Mlc titration factor MtfA (ptsG expression regulator)